MVSSVKARYGAGDGNRTHVISLGSWDTATVRHPQARLLCQMRLQIAKSRDGFAVTSSLFLNRVRSFVLRQGRMTPAQKQALTDHWPRYGVTTQAFDWQTLFPRQAARVVEIGFGMGDSLLQLATSFPEKDFIGIEVYPPGVGNLLAKTASAELSNIRIFQEDAMTVLHKLPPDSVEKVLLFFPDPWPKKKHHKRRLVQLPFMALVTRILQQGGYCHMATDWQPYAEWMQKVLEECPELVNPFGPGQFAPDRLGRPRTKFERRGDLLQHPICDLLYQKRERLEEERDKRFF